MVVEILVGEGCSAEQITDAFKKLNANEKCKAFSSSQFDINRKSILTFMEKEGYHGTFKLTADSKKALFPMEAITKEKDIFYTKGRILVRFQDVWGKWSEWTNVNIIDKQPVSW